MDEEDYYKILGVREDATIQEIKSAFLRKSKQHHPDHNMGDEIESASRFHKVVVAYKTLIDSKSRQQYDRTRRLKSHYVSIPDLSTLYNPQTKGSEDSIKAELHKILQNMNLGCKYDTKMQENKVDKQTTKGKSEIEQHDVEVDHHSLRIPVIPMKHTRKKAKPTTGSKIDLSNMMKEQTIPSGIIMNDNNNNNIIGETNMRIPSEKLRYNSALLERDVLGGMMKVKEIEVELEVSFSESVNGCIKEIEYVRELDCTVCYHKMNLPEMKDNFHDYNTKIINSNSSNSSNNNNNNNNNNGNNNNNINEDNNVKIKKIKKKKRNRITNTLLRSILNDDDDDFDDDDDDGSDEVVSENCGDDDLKNNLSGSSSNNTTNSCNDNNNDKKMENIIDTNRIQNKGPTCPYCQGCSIKKEVNTLSITVPAGIPHKYRIIYQRKGHVIQGKEGDLIVNFKVEQHPSFLRVENDVFCNLPISYPKAVIGGSFQIPTIYSYTSIHIPPGTEHGHRIVLHGLGFPSLENSLLRGDMVVVVSITIPKQLTPEQRQLLLLFENSEPPI